VINKILIDSEQIISINDGHEAITFDYMYFIN